MNTRKEERYCIENSKIKQFIEGISSLTSQKTFLTNYNRTLYFNNSEHEVPFGFSIKARKYCGLPWGEHFVLDPCEEWIFEIKKDMIDGNNRLRQKERQNLKLEEILKITQNKENFKDFFLEMPLCPYMADDYKREHYIIENNNQFRISIDSEIRYYLMGVKMEGIQIGKEDYHRVEIKAPKDKIESSQFKEIKILLQQLGAELTISKKDTAYNLLSEYLRKKSSQFVKPSDTEIEAKLSLDRENQHIFHKIKNDFYKGLIGEFEIIKHFPYTLEGGKLHKYIFSEDNKFRRISIKGKLKKITSKENLEIVNDPFGLNCIIKRNEIKEPLSQDFSLLPSKTIYRKRKYFIVENKKNYFSYCILIDRCAYEGKELFQMEIEGLLNLPSKKEEEKVIKDIAFITNHLIKKYPILKPTPQTKLEWLKGL